MGRRRTESWKSTAERDTVVRRKEGRSLGFSPVLEPDGTSGTAQVGQRPALRSLQEIEALRLEEL